MGLTKSEDGILIVDGSVVAKTRQCCHCGGHFVMEKKSGKLRGWCMKCHHITCGKLECCKCIPFEKKLDLIEKGQMIFV